MGSTSALATGATVGGGGETMIERAAPAPESVTPVWDMTSSRDADAPEPNPGPAAAATEPAP